MRRSGKMANWLIVGGLGILVALFQGALLGGDEVAGLERPELRAELLRRREVDQRARREYLQRLKKASGGGADGASDEKATGQGSQAERDAFRRQAEAALAIDGENTAWLKEVVAKHGWPTRSMVGDDGAHAAWLLVQHADADPAFQRACLDRMTKLPREEVSPANVAYLTDRVLLAEGKQQRYGTQFHAVDGKQQPRPREDPAGVDERRAAVGLMPLAEYAELIERLHGKQSRKP